MKKNYTLSHDLRNLWTIFTLITTIASAQVNRVGDINPGPGHSFPNAFLKYDSSFYFQAINGAEPGVYSLPRPGNLYRLNNATSKADFVSPVGNVDAIINGKFYGFRFRHKEVTAVGKTFLESITLHEYDPLSGTSRQIASLSIFESCCRRVDEIHGVRVVNGKLVFRQVGGYPDFDAQSAQMRIYTYDPATGQLSIRYTGYAGFYANSFGETLGGLYYFTATDSDYSTESLYQLNVQTGLVTQRVVLDPYRSTEKTLIGVIDNKIYYSTISWDESGRRFFSIEPATQTRTEFFNTSEGNSDFFTSTIYNGKIYFRAFIEGSGSELHVHDPATGTTTIVADLNPGPDGSEPADYFAYDNKLLFIASTPSTGRELFAYDTTTQTISLFAEVAPGSTAGFGGFERTYYSVDDNGKLYFNALSNGQYRLHQFDPAAGQPQLVPGQTSCHKNIRSVGQSATFENKVYFAGITAAAGLELFVYDPTDSLTIRLSSQADVDEFNCATVDGKLVIAGANITNLNGLSELTAVSGGLVIRDNPKLKSILGFPALEEAQGLIILSNPLLDSIDAFNQLAITDKLQVQSNNALRKVKGFSSLDQVNYIQVSANPSLADIGGLAHIQTANRLTVKDNTQLTECCGLYVLLNNGTPNEINSNGPSCSSAQTILLEGPCGGIPCSGNVTLATQYDINSFNCPSFDGNLTIDGDNIVDLTGLEDLQSITGGNLTIRNNWKLSGMNALSGLDTVDGDIIIHHNPRLDSINLTLTELTGKLQVNNNSGLDHIAIGVNSIGGSLLVEYNNSLTNLDGLSTVQHVGTNLKITNNPLLTECCGLYDLLSSASVGGITTIQDNGANCTEEEILSNCGAMISTVSTRVYPNPIKNDDKVHLNFNAPEGPATLMVLDFTGTVVIKKEVMLVQGDNDLTLDAVALPAGLHFVRLNKGNTVILFEKLYK